MQLHFLHHYQRLASASQCKHVHFLWLTEISEYSLRFLNIRIKGRYSAGKIVRDKSVSQVNQKEGQISFDQSFVQES